jgi:hypothetical protein
MLLSGLEFQVGKCTRLWMGDRIFTLPTIN